VTLKTVRDAAESGGRGELIDAVAQEVVAEARQRKNPLHDFRAGGALAGREILEELAAVNRVVSAKATPEEAGAFRGWLQTAAEEAANAAKEGGFLGFHAERLSEGEQRMLDKLAEGSCRQRLADNVGRCRDASVRRSESGSSWRSGAPALR
jgi:hypothetical protein